MSGHLGGVQAKLQSVIPSAIYVHCYAHRLNLVLVDTERGIKQIENFCHLLEELYVFFCSAIPHAYFKKDKAKLVTQQLAVI